MDCNPGLYVELPTEPAISATLTWSRLTPMSILPVIRQRAVRQCAEIGGSVSIQAISRNETSGSERCRGSGLAEFQPVRIWV